MICRAERLYFNRSQVLYVMHLHLIFNCYLCEFGINMNSGGFRHKYIEVRDYG